MHDGMYVYTYTYIYICIHICVHTYVCVYRYIISVSMFICMHRQRDVFVCIYVYINICIYIYRWLARPVGMRMLSCSSQKRIGGVIHASEAGTASAGRSLVA